MKISHIFIGILALLIPLAIWYTSTATQCPVPLTYRVGSIDESFSLPLSEAQADIDEAAKLWEDSLERDLFVYDENSDFTINFVFDERQETLNQEQDERQELDQTKEQNDEVLEQVQALQSQYDSLAENYEANVKQYEADLAKYNTAVNTYNDRGGAPADKFSELEKERQRLSQVADNLGVTVSKLNSLGDKINELGRRGNQLIDQYNNEVNEYNAEFGFAREFTQGDYQGNKINIYTFSDKNELITVLAHEFGHALGIDHVESKGSLMYYLIDETDPDTVTELSADDTVAFLEVCGATESTAQKVRHLIRTLLTKFK